MPAIRGHRGGHASGSTRTSSSSRDADRTRAVLPVHVFGRPCRIEPIVAIARRAGWPSSRTPARASAQRWTGGRSAASATSSVVRVLPEQADHDRRRRHGRHRRPGAGRRRCAACATRAATTDGTWLRHVRLGYNYRLDELSAALGVAQLERWPSCGPGRDRVAAAYERGARRPDWVTLPTAGPGRDRRLVRVRRSARSATIDRDRLIGRLARPRRAVPPVLQPAPPPAVLSRASSATSRATSR